MPIGHDVAAIGGVYADTPTMETRTIDVAAGVIHMRVGRSATARVLVPATRGTPFRPVARDLFESDDEGWRFADDVGWRFERDGRGRVVRLAASTDRARGVVLMRATDRRVTQGATRATGRLWLFPSARASATKDD